MRNVRHLPLTNLCFLSGPPPRGLPQSNHPDGMRMYLADRGVGFVGHVYASGTQGSSWTAVTPGSTLQKWRAIAASTSGEIVLVCAEGYLCFTSTNSGAYRCDLPVFKEPEPNPPPPFIPFLTYFVCIVVCRTRICVWRFRLSSSHPCMNRLSP